MNIRDLLLPSFTADSLALETHWIYSQRQIQELHPEGLPTIGAPRTNYHAGKVAGDFTHYGDQTLVLLRSLVKRGGFAPETWAQDWTAFWESQPISYLDRATAATLANDKQGTPGPSTSDDLAASARLAPLLVAMSSAPIEEAIAAARAQNGLTHGDPAVIDSAEFFTRLTRRLAMGEEITDAVALTADECHCPALQPNVHLARLPSLINRETRKAAKELGLTCHISAAFPLTLYLLQKHGNTPVEALRENVMAGGDSAARGMILGYLLGAAHGSDWLPADWIRPIRQSAEIETLITVINESRLPSI